MADEEGGVLRGMRREINRTVRILIFLMGAVLFCLYFEYGTIEPCGIMHAQVRQRMQEGHDKIGDLLGTVLPDAAIDRILSLRYGNIKPLTCMRIIAETLGNTEINPTRADAKSDANPLDNAMRTPAAVGEIGDALDKLTGAPRPANPVQKPEGSNDQKQTSDSKGLDDLIRAQGDK